MTNRFSSYCLTVLVALFTLSACSEEPAPWSDKDILKNLKIMEDAGIAFAVHDICIPMIVEDEAARARVSSEIEAKRFAELLAYDTAVEFDRLVEFFERKGGTEDQILALTEAHQASYDTAEDEINTLGQCEETVINYHNTILNTGVRSK